MFFFNQLIMTYIQINIDEQNNKVFILLDFVHLNLDQESWFWIQINVKIGCWRFPDLTWSPGVFDACASDALRQAVHRRGSQGREGAKVR